MNTKPNFSNLNAVFVSTRNADEQKNSIIKIGEILSSLGLEMLLQTHTAEALGLRGYHLDDIFAKTKLVISLGGDGNYIGACRRFAKRGAFVFGVHTGHLGFLTDTTLDDCKEFLEDILKGNFKINFTNLLEANFIGNENAVKLAFNDITLIRKNPASTAHIEAFLGDFHFNSYYGDGVIIASPMGSTAYNLSTGGAIIHPDAKVFSLTPICSHSLSQRPLILSDDFIIKFTSKDDVAVIIDGQDHLDLKDFSFVEVKKSAQQIGLIHKEQRNYFKVLKEKLRWGHQ